MCSKDSVTERMNLPKEELSAGLENIRGMKFFDPHVHMTSRTTDDYQAMADAGIVGLIEPAFWLGQPRTGLDTFRDYYSTLIGWERFRSSQFGIKHYCTIGLNSREANNQRLADEVMEILPLFIYKEGVVGVGEIGFDDQTELEEKYYRIQLALAKEAGLPVQVHTPHRDKKKGIAKSMILSYSTGKKFDSIIARYAPYKNRFEVWCGFDYTGNDQPGWAKRAVAELERCHKKGAIGVGELGDKGLGELYSWPTPGYGIHIDDPKMQPLIQKCGELKMPISIHVSEDAWMYEKPDLHNDGLMNSAKWNVDQSKPGLLGHDALLATLENAVKNNPNTTFIACHLANRCADLNTLGNLLDKYPNLYADVAARYGEIAPIPRFVHDFLEKYADRIVYGTDMGPTKNMYETTFRILESSDEHFYEIERFEYHWPLNGLYLTDATLEKIYNGNGKKILGR